jgi:hypothetical protein
MSCEAHRAYYFDHLAETLEEVDANQLKKLYQAACNQPNGDMAELAELKTRLLFGDMQGLGIKPPTHSASGLPKKKSQHGYAAIYDHLKQQGYFEQKKNGKKSSDNGNAKPKREPMTSQQFKAKIAQTLREQRDHGSEEITKPENKEGPGQTREIAPERLEAITQQAQKGLSFVGLTEEDTSEHVERFPVWQMWAVDVHTKSCVQQPEMRYGGATARRTCALAASECKFQTITRASSRAF